MEGFLLRKREHGGGRCRIHEAEILLYGDHRKGELQVVRKSCLCGDY